MRVAYSSRRLGLGRVSKKLYPVMSAGPVKHQNASMGAPACTSQLQLPIFLGKVADWRCGGTPPAQHSRWARPPPREWAAQPTPRRHGERLRFAMMWLTSPFRGGRFQAPWLSNCVWIPLPERACLRACPWRTANFKGMDGADVVCDLPTHIVCAHGRVAAASNVDYLFCILFCFKCLFSVAHYTNGLSVL